MILRCLAAGSRFEHREAALLVDLEQQVGGVVARHPREHRGDLLVGALAQELDLVLVVELLEHVGLELLVVRRPPRGSPRPPRARPPRRGRRSGPGAAARSRRRGELQPRASGRGRRTAPRPATGRTPCARCRDRGSRRGSRRHSRDAEGSDRCRPPARCRPRTTSSTSRAVTSRAVSTLIMLRSSTSARSSTSPGRRSNCARLSFVVEVRAAARLEPLDAVDRDEQLATADPRLRGRRRPAAHRSPSSRATTSSTRPRRSPAASSSGLPAIDDRWTIALGKMLNAEG